MLTVCRWALRYNVYGLLPTSYLLIISCNYTLIVSDTGIIHYRLSFVKHLIQIKWDSFSEKEKLPETFSYGAVADDTLPRNDRAYELPITTIYKVKYFID